MSAPGFWEIIFLAILALMIFGPERLPKLAKGAGQAIAQFKREASGTISELKAAAEFDEFTGVANELRETTADLERSTRLSGPIASSARPEKPHSATMPTAVAELAPPFDPDTP